MQGESRARNKACKYGNAQRQTTILGYAMKKYSINISGHATSISLEEPFWQALNDIAKKQGKSLNQIITEIDKRRSESNLSAAVRVFILNYLQEELSNK